MLCFWVLVVLLVHCSTKASSQLYCPRTWTDFKAHLQDISYDRQERPSMAVAPHGTRAAPADLVSVQIYITSVSEVNMLNQNVKLFTYFRRRWTDARLAFDANCSSQVVADPNEVKSVLWWPDAYVDNAMDVKEFSSALIIYPDGFIWSSTNTRLVLDIPMNFGRYPFDQQDVRMVISTYAQSQDDVILTSQVNPDDPEIFDGFIYGGSDMIEFNTSNARSDIGRKLFGSTWYSWIVLKVTLSRKPRAYALGVGVPSLLFAGVTYAGLFINRNVAPARVASALLPVLIMLNLMLGETKAIPKVDYRVFMIDWLVLYVALTIILVFEYSVVQMFLVSESTQAKRLSSFVQAGKLAKQIKSRLNLEAKEAEKKEAENAVALSSGQVEVQVQRAEDPSSQDTNQEEMTPRTCAGLFNRAREATKRQCLFGAPAEKGTVRTLVHSLHSLHSLHSQVEDVELSKDERMLLKVQTDLKVFYDKVDTSENGTLDEHEIQRLLRKFGRYLSMDEVRVVFMNLFTECIKPDSENKSKFLRTSGFALEKTELQFEAFVESGLNLGLFTEFMMNFEHHSPPENLNPSFWNRPWSERIDIAFQVLFPIIWIISAACMAIALAFTDTYAGSKMDA